MYKVVIEFMMQILVGTNIDGAKVTVETRKSSSEPFVKKECSLSEACEITLLQVVDTVVTRLPNPVTKYIYRSKGVLNDYTELERVSTRNARAIRDVILAYGK